MTITSPTINAFAAVRSDVMEEEREVRSQALPVGRRSPDQLHPFVLGLMAGAFAWMFLVFWIVFKADKESSFAVAISIGYAVIYFAVPLICVKVGERHGAIVRDSQTFRTFLTGDMNTFTGPIKGWEATVQVCGIPFGLAFAATGIALALRFI